jgi:tyrosine-protein phosphatase SIW14
MTITNFGQVDARTYRGAQPTTVQFTELSALGITGVLDLRGDYDRQAEEAACAALDIQHLDIPIGDQDIPIIGELGVLPPTRDQVKACLAFLQSPGKHFVHCEHGEDRTGAIIAVYRMVVDSWPNKLALQEAISYHINPMQLAIRDFIAHFNPEDYR